MVAAATVDRPCNRWGCSDFPLTWKFAGHAGFSQLELGVLERPHDAGRGLFTSETLWPSTESQATLPDMKLRSSDDGPLA